MRAFVFALALVWATLAAGLPARAQSGDTPQQLQAMIANGQAPAALSELQTILQAHPSSGVAWYLTAEAQDVLGNEGAARSALGNAEHFAPGLPFANQSDAAALQAHLNGGTAAPVRHHSGFGSGFALIIVLVVLFMVFRMFLRSRRSMGTPGFQGGYGRPNGPGPYPYNQGPGMGQGMGIGGSLLGGLAAGAGFAAGERVIDDVIGGNHNAVDPAWGNQAAPDAGMDDGLQGSPGWDSGSAPDDGGGFDPNNNW